MNHKIQELKGYMNSKFDKVLRDLKCLSHQRGMKITFSRQNYDIFKAQENGILIKKVTSISVIPKGDTNSIHSPVIGSEAVL